MQMPMKLTIAAGVPTLLVAGGASARFAASQRTTEAQMSALAPAALGTTGMAAGYGLATSARTHGVGVALHGVSRGVALGGMAALLAAAAASVAVSFD